MRHEKKKLDDQTGHKRREKNEEYYMPDIRKFLDVDGDAQWEKKNDSMDQNQSIQKTRVFQKLN